MRNNQIFLNVSYFYEKMLKIEKFDKLNTFSDLVNLKIMFALTKMLIVNVDFFPITLKHLLHSIKYNKLIIN